MTLCEHCSHRISEHLPGTHFVWCMRADCFCYFGYTVDSPLLREMVGEDA